MTLLFDDKMSFHNYSLSHQIMETESDVQNPNASVRRIKYRSNLPMPKSMNISKFGYQESSKPPLHLPGIEQLKPETKSSISEKKMCISSIHIGERVCVSGTKLGVLRFYGNTSFASGWWCGIELEEPVGKNSGIIDGVTYFMCPENHGIFAPPSKVQLIDESVNISKNLDCGDGDSKGELESFGFKKMRMSETSENVTVKSKLMAPKVYPKSLPPMTRNVNNCSYVIEDGFNTTQVLSKDLNVTVNIGRSKSDDIVNMTFDKSPELISKMAGNEAHNCTFLKEDEDVKVRNDTFDKESGDKSYLLPEIEGFEKRLMNITRDIGKLSEESIDLEKISTGSVEIEKTNEELVEDVKIEVKSEKDDYESFDCDDSLGILTPSQMVDSMFGDSQLLKTPSFEDVLELNDEVVEELIFSNDKESIEPKVDSPDALTSTPVHIKDIKMPKLPDIWTVPTPKARLDESFFYLSQFINTPETPAIQKSIPKNKIDLVDISPISDFHDTTLIFRNRVELTEKKLEIDNNDNNGSKKSIKLNIVADNLSKEVINESLRHVSTVANCTVPLTSLDVGKLEELAPTEILIEKMGNNFCEVIDKKDRPMSSLTMSVTSIDTGYQGDAECDVHSGAPSAANTPIEDQKKFGVDEKDLLLMISGDGHNFLRHPRTDIGSDSDFCSDMATSWTESEVENEEKGRGRAARVIDGTLYYNDVNNEKNNGHVMCNIVIPNDEKDVSIARSSDSSTLDETLTEKLDTVVSTSSTDEKMAEVNSSFVVAPVNAPDVTIISENSSMDCQGDEVVEIKVEAPLQEKKKLATRNRKRNDVETPTKKFKSPKKNVMSKIKAMIEATTCKSSVNVDGGGDDVVVANEVEKQQEMAVKKAVRTPRKNSRWEAVMSKIAAGQAEEKAKGKAKREIRSRVDTNLSGAKVSVGEVRGKSTCARAVGGPSRLVKRDSNLSELSENISENGGGDNFHSNRSSRSDVSGGKRKPRTPRISTTERPISPSQLSDISTMSAASHLSSLSQTSHRASTSLNTRVANQIEKDFNLSDRPKSTISATVLKNNKKNVANSPMKKLPPNGALAAKKAQSSFANGGSSRTTITSPKPKVTATSTSKRVPSSNLTSGVGTIQSCTTQSRLATASRGSIPQQRSNKSVPATSQVQLGAKAEQNRVRNLKVAPVIKSGHHQPDLLNLSSVATTETEADKEIKRLETVCDARAKEISRLRSLLEHRTMGFEAFTVFAKYMVDDLDAFAHPCMIKELKYVRRSLDACKVDLDRAISEKENLQARNADLIVAHQNELDKLKQGHENDVATLKEIIIRDYEEEIRKLEVEFTETEFNLKEKHESEISELKEANEHLLDERLREQIKELRSQHALQINTIETEYDLKVEELTKEFNGINFNLEQQLRAANSKCSDLQRQKKEYEDALLKDNNYKLQVAAGRITELLKEIESLKAVIELRNNEIHELRAASNKVEQLEEELHLSEEKIKLLSTKAEDLQAQVDIKNNKERQISNEKQLLREWFEKESKVNKRLSMENEELQWKLAKSMEAPMLTALFENTPNQSNDNTNTYMTTSTPLLRGASDGEVHKSPSCKRSLPFSSSKIIPSQRSPIAARDERARHHRQRFSISENDSTMNSRDISPASRYRRTQSLSWTVGLKSDDCDLKTDSDDIKLSSSSEEFCNSQIYSELEECEKATEEQKEVDETSLEAESSNLNGESKESEKIEEQNGGNDGNELVIEEKDIVSEKENVEKATASQGVIKHAALERRNSFSPDARVPSLITVQYLDEQNSNRLKIERRSSLGNLKWNEESPLMSRSCRSLSTPYDYQIKKKSPRGSPIKTKMAKKEMAASSVKSVDKDDVVKAALDAIDVDFQVQNLPDLVDKKQEELKMMEESQESVNQRSMTDSEDFSAPLTISLKSDDKISSCDSSPPPEANDLIDQSPSSRSEDSSPRASPQFSRSKMEENSLCVYTMSPRMSAGESMIMDDMPKESLNEGIVGSDFLFRRTFPEFYAQDKCIVKDSSIDDNQGTPESGSLAILPTDSTNIDLSWSEEEDEIPSESEV